MVDRDAVRRGYDDLAADYAAARTGDGRDMDVLREFLASLSTPARVLDVGCGQGTPILEAVCSRATGVGVDVSREQLVLASANVPDAALFQGDMTRLPVRDDAFDALTAFHSLIHVPLDDHQTVVDEFARVVRPGGRVLLTEGQEEWCGSNPDWLDSGVEMQWNVAGAAATQDHLQSTGFTVVDERGLTGTFDDEEEHWVFFVARLDE